MSKVKLSELDFFSAEVQECPFHVYQQLQEEAPVWQMPGTNVFVVTRYDDIREIIRDPGRFSSNFSALLNTGSSNEEVNTIYGKGYEMVETLLTQDPPRHRVYRNLVNKVFSNKRIEGMRSEVEKMSNELINQWIDEPEVDLLNRFCVPLPIYVISDQLGVPRSELSLIKKWSDASASRLGRLADEEEQIQNAKDIVEFQHYFAALLDRMREAPEDNIISDLANNTIDEGRLLTKPEALGMIQQILVAGNETTTSTFAEGMHLLATNPDQVKRVQDDPSLIPNMVEEMLRLSTPTAQMWRICKEETEVHGVKIPAGAAMMIKFASANRDATQFPDPDRFDVTRDNLKTQIAFGQGVHHCLGAPLARQELIIGFQVILKRLAHFRLPEGEAELEFLPSLLLHPPKDLNLLFEPRV